MKKFTGILLILKTYLLAISIFFVFRLILFFTEINRIDFSETSFITIIKAFIMGVRFDIVISGYIMALPALVILILDVLNKDSKLIYKLIFIWIFLFFSISFIISAADIPYFNQFFSRFSISAFEWFDSLGFVFSMVIQEPKYYLISIPLIILIIIFYKILKRIFSNYFPQNTHPFLIKIPVTILFLGIIFLGIRGRIQKKSPIIIGTAYFSDNAFLNQLGLNPSFTLIRSYLDAQSAENKNVQLMDNEQAIQNIRDFLAINETEFYSPIARNINAKNINFIKPNIVLVIMESMSAAKMQRHGNTKNLTPFLDSLSNKSLYFENIYTAGKHTFNGIFGTLFSFPALYRHHPMDHIKNYYGLGSVLKNNGYSTTYFSTHDTQFDNVEGFLRSNDFENIVGQPDYPIAEVKTTLGVPDDFMFKFSIPYLDKLHAKNQPFFATFMTASDHGPYYIPEYFTPKNKEKKDQIVEYADWSIRQFIKMASTKKWFDNTIFIFIADHGAPLTAPYDISLDYHHSPLIYYAPKLLKEPKTESMIGGQIDVFPTLLGLLNLPYTNNTLGIDLLNEKRPFIFVNDDDKIGVLNDSLFLIMKDGEPSKLYKYRQNDKTNYAQNYPEMVTKMETYAKSNMQVYQYMLLNEQTLILDKKK